MEFIQIICIVNSELEWATVSNIYQFYDEKENINNMLKKFYVEKHSSNWSLPYDKLDIDYLSSGDVFFVKSHLIEERYLVQTSYTIIKGQSPHISCDNFSDMVFGLDMSSLTIG
jgi:hypothetical protein